MTAFRDIASCSLVEVYRRFRGVYCLHYEGDRPKTSVNFYEKTRNNIPKDCHFHNCLREKVKSHRLFYV
jgi:hypothetical protein